MILVPCVTITLVAVSVVVAIVRRHQTKTKDLPYRKSAICARSIFYIILPVTVAVLLRVHPYLISGLLFSVDSWPSIRYAELLLAHTPVRLDDANIFGGGYDELGDKLFGTVVSALTGLQLLWCSSCKCNSCVEFSEAKVIKRVQTIGTRFTLSGSSSCLS